MTEPTDGQPQDLRTQLAETILGVFRAQARETGTPYLDAEGGLEPMLIDGHVPMLSAMDAVLAKFLVIPRDRFEFGVEFTPPDVSPWVQPFDSENSALLYAQHHNHVYNADGGATAVRRPHVELPEWEPIPSEETA